MRKHSRKIIDDLLRYAIRFAEHNDEPRSGDCWRAIQAARAHLGEAAEQSPEQGRAEQRLRAGAVRASSALSELAAEIRAEGWTIGDCIRALAVPNDDPYVVAARALIAGDDDQEIDDQTTTARGDGGAWVLSWLWIGNEKACVLSNAELWEQVLDHALQALDGDHGLDAQTLQRRQIQAAWLEALLTGFEEQFNDIASVRHASLPRAITWCDRHGHTERFMPSDALAHLRGLARKAGLPDDLADQSERFCMRLGNTLDAALTVLRGGWHGC